MKLPGTETQPENIYIAMGKLDIKPNMVFLDVGCGSGAVSLAASRYTESIYGIDIREEAVKASRSRVRIGTFFHGNVLEILPKIPRIDRCFIGGTRGIDEFLPDIVERSSPGCRFVIDLARLGITARVAKLLDDCCTLEEIIQIQINRGYDLAGDIALRPINPIFMVVGHS